MGGLIPAMRACGNARLRLRATLPVRAARN
jgi:hypothetical protein